ncbi:Host specificity protein [Escherichia coli]|nr:Host specificity protein [Escherichia coli]
MGKGGGKAHTPREAKDNLKSTQMMSVIDAIGEGPIEGPVKGLQSILVNKTPLTDTDGNPVIHGVTAVWRAGEQEQTPPEGFESSGAETGLGVEVTKAKPVTRTITSANIDRLRVTFGVQSLVETTSKGDRNPATVRLLIQLQRNGNWVTEKDVTINGKTTSQFLASVILDNLPPRPFNIRMVRETADSTTDQLQNKTLWSSYTEIIDVKQCYPNTAIVGLQVDAEQFGGQQMTVNYHIRGRIIQVPSNYDPEKTHVQWYLGRQSETGIQQQPGLVPVGHADSPALRHGKTSGGGGCGQVGAVCHRAVLRSDGPGWFRGDRAADDL